MIKETEEVQAALKDNETQLKLRYLHLIATELASIRGVLERQDLRGALEPLASIRYALEAILERIDVEEVEDEEAEEAEIMDEGDESEEESDK